MRSVVGDRLLVLLLVVMVVASVSLKNSLPDPVPPPAGWLDRAIAARLATRGFALGTRRLPLGTILIEGRRGACIVLARDGSGAIGTEIAYTDSARDVGPVAFLYDGRRYAHPPALWMRIDRLWRDTVRVTGHRSPPAVPIALAASPRCGADMFGLADIHLPT